MCSARFRSLRSGVRSCTEVAARNRGPVGTAVQLVGFGSALAGVFVLWGLGVGLLLGGGAVVVIGTLYEAGRL
jgi:hypothetical protein